MMEKNTHFHFRGQMDTEIVKDFYRRHWVVLLPRIFNLILFLSLIIIFLVALMSSPIPPEATLFVDVLVVMAIVAIGILIHSYFIFMLEYFMNVVIITDNRLIITRKTLFTHDDKDSIYMQEIQDLQKQQAGIVKNFLDYGEIMINVGVPDLTILRTVPNPDYHFRLLNMIRNQRYIEDEERIGKGIQKEKRKEEREEQDKQGEPPADGSMSNDNDKGVE
jgi:hypothetical protein